MIVRTSGGRDFTQRTVQRMQTRALMLHDVRAADAVKARLNRVDLRPPPRRANYFLRPDPGTGPMRRDSDAWKEARTKKYLGELARVLLRHAFTSVCVCRRGRHQLWLSQEASGACQARDATR